ncbi:MAG TPA: HAD family hydrolase [Alphaproteobacteria bacterium]|nr:HAD family hydrolase [Alphaproteobacteria bacterium]HNS43606.1 HAD family hydrolase [Alphaproteobacteria bacterium]
MKYKLAVFDWNGTLLDDAVANVKGTNATLKLLERPPITLERYRETMDFPVTHLYARNGIDPDTYLANSDRLADAFYEAYGKASEASPLRTGTHELLDWLLDNGVTTMILSNYLQEELEGQMAQRHVHHKFKHICGNDRALNKGITRTTKLERLKVYLDKFGYDPTEAFIIGDSFEEIEVGKHLGMLTVSVTWGCFSKERLEKGGAHHMIDNLSALNSILQ